MKQNKRFDDVLNECFDHILKGETVEQCLLKYPEQAKELEPLLRTALAARVSSTIQPRPEFKAKARYEFQTALRDMQSKKKQRRFSFNWRPQWQLQTGWGVALVAIIVFVLGGGGTVAASASSMPGDALYSVKLTSEQVQLAVTPSDLGKAELNAKFADRRADEIIYVASKGNAQEVQIVAQRLNTNLQNITSLASNEGVKESAANSRNTAPNSASGTNSVDQNTQQPMLGVAAASAPASSPDKAPVVAAAPSVMAAPPQAATGGGIPPASAAVTPAPDAASAPIPSARAAVPAPAAPPAFSASKAVTDSNTSNADRSFAEDNQKTSNNSDANNAKLSNKDKLKQIIISNFNARQNRLEAALKNASPQVRPALRQAIAQSEAEFDKALKNIEQPQNAK